LSSQFTLGAKERLKSRKQIDTLFSTGKKLNTPPFRVYYAFHSSPTAPLLFGVGVSSKVFRKAVDRNRVKRQVRECWRLQKSPLGGYCKQKELGLHVFVVYTGRETGEFADLFAVMGKVVEQLLSVAEKK
jgi:ribonuclease P protein component